MYGVGGSSETYHLIPVVPFLITKAPEKDVEQYNTGSQGSQKGRGD